VESKVLQKSFYLMLLLMKLNHSSKVEIAGSLLQLKSLFSTHDV